jgi:hypothetical protein
MVSLTFVAKIPSTKNPHPSIPAKIILIASDVTNPFNTVGDKSPA